MSDFLWVTDCWDSLDQTYDTSLRLMRESLDLCFAKSWCDVKSIELCVDQVQISQYLLSKKTVNTETVVERMEVKERGTSSFRTIMYRPDPPVDLRYLDPL